MNKADLVTYDLEDTMLFLRRAKSLEPAQVASLFRGMTSISLSKGLARTKSESGAIRVDPAAM